MKKNSFYLLIIFLVGWGIWRFIGRGRDYRVGLVAGDGLAMVSISSSRQMINILRSAGEEKVWIPGGLGWYPTKKVLAILDQEKKFGVAEKMFFYNFGFVADLVVRADSVEDWRKTDFFVKNFGLKRWLWYMLERGQMVENESVFSDGLTEEERREIMIRDHSEVGLMTEEKRLVIINESDVDGLAGFLADRIEKSGLVVMEVKNSSVETTKDCLWLYSKRPEEEVSAVILRKILGCEEKQDLGLGENEWEIYLGEDWAEMINYSSYVGAF